ncbi:MAG: ABC transporter permease [Planctomycetes bacterium]|nr:ABC transporter permease [Planctomycetota bacterium]
MLSRIVNPVAQWRAAHDLVAILVARRQLTWELAKRELTEKHAGQAIGAIWTIAHPLIMMLVYVFLFAVVFQAKIETKGLPVPLDFTVYILAGLVPWLVFQESMNKGATAITGNATLVKQVVFPVEILPAKVVLATVLTHVIFAILLIAYVLFRFRELPWTYALIPVLMFFQMLAMAGIAYAVAAAACYIRDLKELVTVFALVNLYLMPAFYLPEWVPEVIRPILYINPFSYMIWCYQDVFFFGSIAHPWAWLVFPLCSIIALLAGYRIFGRLKHHFGSVL